MGVATSSGSLAGATDEFTCYGDCGIKLNLRLYASADNSRQLVCLRIEDGTVMAPQGMWNGTIGSNTVECPVNRPGTYVVGQIAWPEAAPSTSAEPSPEPSPSPSPSPETSPEPSMCDDSNPPHHCNTTVPLMDATVLAAGGLSNCKVGSCQTPVCFQLFAAALPLIDATVLADTWLIARFATVSSCDAS